MAFHLVVFLCCYGSCQIIDLPDLLVMWWLRVEVVCCSEPASLVSRLLKHHKARLPLLKVLLKVLLYCSLAVGAPWMAGLAHGLHVRRGLQTDVTVCSVSSYMLLLP